MSEWITDHPGTRYAHGSTEGTHKGNRPKVWADGHKLWVEEYDRNYHTDDPFMISSNGHKMFKAKGFGGFHTSQEPL